MGKIFSWEQIANRQVPSMIDFKDIKKIIENSFLRCDGIVGAAICGSVLKNEANRRSDIDVVVVYSKKFRWHVAEILQMLMLIAHDRYVPIEFILVDEELAKTDGHGIFRSFYEHLAFATELGGVIKIDPRELITLHYDIIDETLQYIRRKRSTIEKRMTTFLINGPEKYYYLEKIMAAPVYLARKVLRCLDEKSLIHSDSKIEVTLRYKDRFDNSKQWKILEMVNALDQKYTRELERQLKHPNEDDYKEMIEEIEKIAPVVVDFLKINYKLLKDF